MDKTGDKMTKNSQQHTDLYNYNLDHVYCSDNSNYRNAHVNLSASAADLKALRKENKQLQAMLLLHLDLIQEQSNQLIAKDKQLLQMREENEQLRLKCERNVIIERRSNNNKYSGNVTTKVLNTSGGSPTIDSYFAAIDSNQTLRTYDGEKTKLNNNITTNQKQMPKNNVLVEEQKPVINEIRQNIMPNNFTIMHEPMLTLSDDTKRNVTTNIQQFKDRPKIVTTTTVTTNNNRNVTVNDKPLPIKYRTIESGNIIGHNNGKFISKIILQRKQSENGEKIFVRTKNIDMSNNKGSNDNWSAVRMIKKEVIDSDSAKLPTTSTTISKMSILPITHSKNLVPNDFTTSPKKPIKDVYTFVPEQSMFDTSTVTTALPSTKSSLMTQLSPIDDCELESTIKIESDTYESYEKCIEDETLEESHDEESMSELPETIQCDTITPNDSNLSPQIEHPVTSISSLSPTIALSSSSVTSTVSIVNAVDYDRNANNSNDNSSSIVTANNSIITILYPTSKRHMARNMFLTTTKQYKTREWQLDEIEKEAKQLITDEPCKEDDESEANLETPKWRTWELSSNRDAPVVNREYEDMRDEAFARRHSRFLLDERKRKKWDVQRIREQRTIERLKRRHCKDELNQPNNVNEIFSFYPSADQLKNILITDEMPVSAFGEMVPMLPPVEFSLPFEKESCSTPIAPKIAKSEFCTSPTTASTSSTASSTQIVPPIRISNVCSSGFEPSANVSSIIFLTKKRASRTKPVNNPNAQTLTNWKSIT